MDNFEKNIQALNDKELVSYLKNIKTNKQFEIIIKDDPIDINIYDKINDYIFYSTYPLEEITSQYENILKAKTKYPFFGIYGISNGLLIKMLLKQQRYILVIEPNIELLYIALNLFDFSQELKDGYLKIIYEPLINKSLISYLSKGDLKPFLRIYDLEVSNDYYFKFYNENIISTNRHITSTIEHIIKSEGNNAIDSLIGLKHHLHNIPQLLQSFTLKSVATNKNTNTAIIVSTGPSLTKQLPLLKKYQDYVTILCIDASLPILQQENIKPDLVFSLERVEATSEFFKNIDKDFLKDTIFIPTSVSHPKTIEYLNDTKLCISLRPFEYIIMFRLDKWGYIGIGMSAANMAFDFAIGSAFENIIFIGQDLAFSKEGNTHAKGALYGEKENQYYKETITLKGYYGDKVISTPVWDMFLSFLEENALLKSKGLNVYNCTEGGVYIDGMIHKPFKEVLQTLPKIKKSPIQAKKCLNKQIHYLNRSKKLIKLYIKKLSCIKKQIEKIFIELVDLLETTPTQKELTHISVKIDEIKEILNTDKTMQNFRAIINPYIVNVELELADIMVHTANDELLKKWVVAHKKWLFFLAGILENIIFILQNETKF